MKWPRTEPLPGLAPFGSCLFPATILSARTPVSNQNVAEKLDFEGCSGLGAAAVALRPTQRAPRFGFMGRSRQAAGQPLSDDTDMPPCAADESKRATAAFGVVNTEFEFSMGSQTDEKLSRLTIAQQLVTASWLGMEAPDPGTCHSMIGFWSL